MHSLLERHRVLGVAFISMLVLALWLVVAIFNQTFKSWEEVTLSAGTAGLQLPDDADIKVRGVDIGQVQELDTSADGAVVTLGIEPDKMGMLPDNVGAVILPKTLFGEKYVDLTIPENPSSTPLEAGATIEQTAMPVEVEKVLNDLFPLLRAVQPAELNYTLNALATALEGRGDELGDTLETLNSYLVKLNPELPLLVENLRALAEVTDIYADVFPQLADVLRNTTLTGNTLVEKEGQLNAFLRDLTSFSDTTTGFLEENGDNIIRLGEVSEPTLALLARYSPASECLLRGLVRQAPRLASTFRGFIFHIDLQVLDRQPEGYGNDDRTVFGADNGPDCALLPDPPIPFGPLPDFNDGADVDKGPASPRGRAGTGFDQTASPAIPAPAARTRVDTSAMSPEAVQAFNAIGTPNRSRITVQPSGHAEQRASFNALVAPVLQRPYDEMSDVSTLLLAPAFAGTEVSVR